MTKTNKNAPAASLALLTSLKAIEAGIQRIHDAGQALQADMHLVACSALAHMAKNNDARVVQKLIEAMPDMSRKNSLMLWFETFGNVQFVDKVATYAKDKQPRIGDAMAKPFWKFKANEGVPYEAIDIQAWAAANIKKLETDAKKANKDHSGLIAAIRRAATAETFPAAVQ